MRWTVIGVAGILGAAGAVAGLLDARAQQSAGPFVLAASGQGQPGPDGMGFDDNGGPGEGGGHHMRGWMRPGGAGGHPEEPQMGPPPELGLVYDAPDKQLTTADVQKIAEAFLLIHGNHAWKITNVAQDADRITFTVTTAQNALVATFAMNRHTGHLSRTG